MHPVRTVAVIGAGEQGRALAFRAAQAGFTTVLEDVLPSNLRRARAAVSGTSLVTLIESRLAFAGCVEDAAREADLIVDSVPDELESKLEIFSLLDRMAPPRSILLTPTEVLSIADLASCTYRPERCLSFSFPQGGGAEPGNVVRVVHTGQTLPEVLSAVEGFWAALGLTPVLVADPFAVSTTAP